MELKRIKHSHNKKGRTTKNKRKQKKNKLTRKSRKISKRKNLSNVVRNTKSDLKKIKLSCRKECNKGKKTYPIIMKNLGEKMGLKKGDIDKRINEYNKNCEKNCITLLNDKDLMKKIIRDIKKR